MKRLLWVVALFIGGMLVLIAAHFAMVEIGREVVTLRTGNADGSFKETRLWVVDYQGAPWVHSTGSDWIERFRRNPSVELERQGVTQRYRGVPDPAAHPAIDAALRDKYGVADRWVRLIAPCNDSVVPVRLELVDTGS